MNNFWHEVRRALKARETWKLIGWYEGCYFFGLIVGIIIDKFS